MSKKGIKVGSVTLAMKGRDLLQKNGYKVIIEPAKAIAFDNRKVVFLMNLGLGLIEIVESE